MAIFDFSGVFAEFDTSFQVVRKPSGGYRDYSKGGQWVAGDTGDPIDFHGIVVPMTEKDLRFDTSGTYTTDDIKVYVRKPESLYEGDSVIVEGKTYRVMKERIYAPEYSDFRRYVCRRSDVGKGAKENA